MSERVDMMSARMTGDRQYRILIVDDEEAAVQFVDRVVRGAGYDTATAHDAEAAIKVIANQPFDLLLADEAIGRRFRHSHLGDRVCAVKTRLELSRPITTAVLDSSAVE